jgi:hypothetical protein
MERLFTILVSLDICYMEGSCALLNTAVWQLAGGDKDRA